MDLALAFFTGMFLVPWWAFFFFTLACLADIICLEIEKEGWGTSLLLLGSMFLVWVGMGVNPFSWAWNNYAELLRFAAGYLAIGGVWSVVKWTLFLVNLKVEYAKEFSAANRRAEEGGYAKPPLKRPRKSYASENKVRILSWIGHWPFSMLGTLCGEVLTRIVKTIYNLLSGFYDQIGKAIFREID